VRIAFHQQLEEMVMGVDRCRIHHAIGGIEHGLPGALLEHAKGFDDPVADAKVRTGVARRVAFHAGDHGGDVANQQSVRHCVCCTVAIACAC
jgi:hypothetical protein